MKSQVSLGSQPQYRPQAASAQIAPEIPANVQIGNANTWIRNVRRSRTSEAGIRAPRDTGKLRLPVRSQRRRIRNIAAGTKPTMNTPEEIEAAVTWMASQ